MQLSGLDAGRQGLSRPEQLLLTDELVQRARPHAIGERPQCVVHLWGVPITSAPAGGLKLTSPAATGPLRSIFWKTMVAV